MPTVVDLGALCEQALPGVYRRARMLLPPSEVDDVVQETFLSATRSWKSWRRASSFRTWVHAILRYRVADYYRHRERQVETICLDEFDNVHLAPEDFRVCTAVQITLAELPPKYQEVLFLRLAEGLKFADVAQSLGISLEAAKSRYRRAVDRFAREWDV